MSAPMDHLDGALVDLLLGELDERERRDAEAHVAACARCRADLDDLRAVRASVAGAPPALPSEHVWGAISAAITREPVALPESSQRRWSRPRILAFGGAAAAALLVAGLIGAWAGRAASGGDGDAGGLVGAETDDLVFTLAPPSPTSPGSGRIFMSEDRSRGLVAVSGMPALEPGKLYAVWLVRNDQQRLSLGRFEVDARGASLTSLVIPVVDYDQWAEAFVGLAVTEVDPANPSVPSGPDLLVGPLY